MRLITSLVIGTALTVYVTRGMEPLTLGSASSAVAILALVVLLAFGWLIVSNNTHK